MVSKEINTHIFLSSIISLWTFLFSLSNKEFRLWYILTLQKGWLSIWTIKVNTKDLNIHSNFIYLICIWIIALSKTFQSKEFREATMLDFMWSCTRFLWLIKKFNNHKQIKLKVSLFWKKTLVTIIISIIYIYIKN